MIQLTSLQKLGMSILLNIKENRKKILNCVQLYTLSGNGQLCIWECDTELDGLIPVTARSKQQDEGEKASASESDSDDDADDEEKKKADNAKDFIKWLEAVKYKQDRKSNNETFKDWFKSKKLE